MNHHPDHLLEVGYTYDMILESIGAFAFDQVIEREQMKKKDDGQSAFLDAYRKSKR